MESYKNWWKGIGELDESKLGQLPRRYFSWKIPRIYPGDKLSEGFCSFDKSNEQSKYSCSKQQDNHKALFADVINLLVVKFSQVFSSWKLISVGKAHFLPYNKPNLGKQ